MLEKEIQSKIVQWINRQPGMFVIKTHATAYSQVGIPDLICCVKGRFVAMEVKRPGGTTSKIQQLMIQKIISANGIAGIVHSLDEAIELIGRVM